MEWLASRPLWRPLTPGALSQLGTAFLGVLLNPPWGGALTPSHLAALQLEKLCPLGFVFVWVEKEVLSDVVDVFVKAQFVYVENLTWVHMAPNNRARPAQPRRRTRPLTPLPQVVEGKTAFTGRSHRTLLIFRRDVRKFEAAKKIELRHQRNPDVDICVVNTGAGARCRLPSISPCPTLTTRPTQTAACSPPSLPTLPSRRCCRAATRLASRGYSWSSGRTRRSGAQAGRTSCALRSGLQA